MKQETIIFTDQEFLKNIQQQEESDFQINILNLDTARLHKHLNISVQLKSSLFILVLNGTAGIEINFRRHPVSPGKIILLSFGHFFKINEISSDFEALVLYVSKEYIDEMFSTEMIYKRVKFGVRMHKMPLLKLRKEESDLLVKRMSFISEIVKNEKHRYYKEMILNALLIFLLDLGNIIEKEDQEESTIPQSREKLYFQRFLELLVQNYKTAHHVEFYADKLHITTHYLTLIVKRLSGQSVSDLIFQLLYSEAKVLLQPNSSIQQIAEELRFSDQSAFGKFFKRKSGFSPREFRERRKL